MTKAEEKKKAKELKEDKENLLIRLEEINPFNRDNDLYNIADQLNILTIKDVQSEYEKIDQKSVKTCRKYIGKDYEIGKVMYKIFDKFIDDSNVMSRIDILKYIKEDLGYSASSDDSINYLLNGSLGTLKCLHLIKNNTKSMKSSFEKDNILYNKTYTYYTMEINKWFAEQKYYIYNKSLLKILAPILIQYSRSSISTPVPKFFDKIDSVLEYVLQPFENHNENFELEKYFLDNINNEVSTRMVDNSGSKDSLTLTMDKIEIFTKIITITPIRILFGEDEKYLEYSDKNDETYTVTLSDIVRIQIYDTNIIDNIKEEITQDFSCVNSYITDKDKKGNDYYYICNPKYLEAFKDKVSIEDKLYTIILELPLTALEFFKIQPLDHMKIYAKADEIVEFETIIKTEELKSIIPREFKIKDSYFYVIANDTLNNATAIVLDTLSDIRIVAPKNLHQKVISIFNKYSSNSRL
ncbi:hypothetical protein [Candidatus Sulfurimonas baltica]|uniref:Uncharacterized protein n=1 Tax=Candidatus Sulfurimonas baltica TaxID=2740404 RepID=A0A7S7LVS4_9BACT|nr:hypothetical protein [Candidatus Sulfurimonas baltica]QOY52295.1 hypothetical protein HUE88_00955 [Candidatus Sulfurimonas baltica]